MKRTVIGLLVAVGGALMLGEVFLPTRLAAAPLCSPDLNQRTPQQVLADFRAALAAGDWAAVRCNLDDDAVMISDNGVTNGENEIVAEYQALRAFFGGFFDQVYQEIIVPVLGGNRFMARVLYTVDTACSDVPDGIDTYIIKGGEIAALTTHGFIMFTC